MDDFELAKNLCAQASSLDWVKNRLPFPIRSMLAEQVEEMHDKAQYLAGDRVNELYCSEENLDD